MIDRIIHPSPDIGDRTGKEGYGVFEIGLPCRVNEIVLLLIVIRLHGKRDHAQ